MAYGDKLCIVSKNSSLNWIRIQETETVKYAKVFLSLWELWWLRDTISSHEWMFREIPLPCVLLRHTLLTPYVIYVVIHSWKLCPYTHVITACLDVGMLSSGAAVTGVCSLCRFSYRFIVTICLPSSLLPVGLLSTVCFGSL